VKQAALLLFGSLCKMPRSRLAAHVFHNRCADVASGDRSRGKYSWCKVAKETLEATPFGSHWQSLSVPDRWKELVKRHFSRQRRAVVRADVASHHSLELFGQLTRSKGVEAWLNYEVQHPGKTLKVKLRAGALPLMVHVGVANLLRERRLRQCVVCGSGAVETEQHFVVDCPFYADLRTRCLARLRGLLEPVGEYRPDQLNFLEFIAGSWSSTLPESVRLKAEKCAWDFLRLAWVRREAVWQRVCVDGNPWRLPAPH